MLCCSEQCTRKNQCALFYRNPQPEYRKYDNVEPLDSHGWGSISSNGCEAHYDCGPLRNYKMFEQISDQMLYEKTSIELSLLSGIAIYPEQVKALVEKQDEFFDKFVDVKNVEVGN